MQDIRKPYTRSRSNNDLQSRVEQFEAARYSHSRYEDEESYDDPVQIPVKRTRRDVRDMDMYPKRRDSAPSRRDERDYEDGRDEDAPYERRKASGRFSFGTIAFIGSIIILVGAIIAYTYIFDSATITVVPKYKDSSDFNRTFVFAKEGSGKEGIPFIATTTTFSKSKALTFSETRKVQTKASGKVTLYNAYSSAPQKLITNTRLLSSKGKIYRIHKSVEIPGKKGDKEGSIEVMLYADDFGKEYNTEAMDFSIPGFKGTPEEKGFYAKTTTGMRGGASGNTSLVSLSDLNAAKDSLMLALDKEIKDAAQKIKLTNYTSLPTTLEIVYTDNQDEVLAGGTEIYKITGVGYSLLVPEADLAKAIGKTLVDYKDEPVRLDTALPLSVTRKEEDHLAKADSLSLLVEGNPRVIWITDKESIKSILVSKKSSEFKSLMKSVNSIESAELTLTPPWLSSFPSTLAKITVTETLPKR